MPKSADAFRTISEVADDLDIPKHVLRFWEVKFVQIRPMKRGGGRRYYRPEDMELLRGIQHLLHREGYTIKGVQKILREQGVEAVKLQGRGDEDGLAPGGEAATIVRPVAQPTLAPKGRLPAQSETVLMGPRATGMPSPRPAMDPTAAKKPKAALPGPVMPVRARLDDAGRDRIQVAIKELESCRSLLTPQAAQAGATPATAEVTSEPHRSGARR